MKCMFLMKTGGSKTKSVAHVFSYWLNHSCL